MKLLYIHKTTRDAFEIEKGYQPYSSIFYMTAGSFKIYLYDKWVTVKKGDVIYLPCTLYFEREIIEPIEFYYLTFTDDNDYFHCGGILNIRDMTYFETTIQYIMDSFKNCGMQKVKNVMLESVFCQNALNMERMDNNIPRLRECMNYIDEHFCEDISLDFLCSLTGYSKTILIEKFKEGYNSTPGAYINRLRMDKAKKYLTDTCLPVAEIALLCGFHCQYYFSNVFKKHCGEAPLKYRKKHKI